MAKLEQMQRSSMRSGLGRRIWEERFLREEINSCLETFAGYFPADLEPLLRYTREELASDLDYLQRVISAG